MTKYEVKVWHRGWADWAWRLRYNDHGACTPIAVGSASTRIGAREKAQAAALLDGAERAAAWREIDA